MSQPSSFDRVAARAQTSPRRSMDGEDEARLSVSEQKHKFYVGDYIDTDCSIQTCEMRLTPDIPGRPAGELPRMVFISSQPAPKGKGEK